MHSKIIQLSAWLCLAIQLTGLSTAVVTAAPAFATETPRSLFSSKTALYILKEGDSVASVAKKFKLSIADLKTANQFRTFNKPFEQLGPGDELDVPLPQQTSQLNQNSPSSNQLEESASESLAGKVFAAGEMFNSGDFGHSAASKARSMATGSAASSAEGWLGQFGTARIDLNMDDDFNLDGSSIDFLVPIYDANENVMFTQLGYRNQEDRNTINIGLGFRTFHGSWMYGVNTFYDDDFTGHNRRIGFGLEAWADYIKLSANSYSGITDWHQSRDFADYDERPADGFDIRAEGWLPSYPQLGGKLVYEQYSGNEVALFSKDERSNDPRAVTLGINYTPFPLVTIGVDHRQGQGGQNDTQLNLELTYRLEESWATQVDPAAVDISRTLSRSRYDLVERNNNIVLEYKKQDLIHLTLPAIITGKSGGTDILTAVVKAKYGTDRVEWDYEEILAAGGSVVNLDKQTLQITYPPYNSSGTKNSNLYHIRAVAYDTQDNASNRSTTEAHVSEPDAAIASGDFVVTHDGAAANGNETNTVQAKITDQSHHPVEGVSVTFTADNGAALLKTTVLTDTYGLAETKLTNTTPGEVTVTATANGSSQSVKTTFGSGDESGTIAKSDMVVDPNEAKSDGTDVDTVKVVVKDINNNVLKNVPVIFSISGSGATVTQATVNTNDSGEASTNITSLTAGSYTVTAKVSSSGNTQTAQAIFVADERSGNIAKSDMVIEPNGAKSDGTDVDTVKVVVKDINNNILKNVPVTFSISGSGATVAQATANTNDSGEASTNITSLTAGSYTVTAKVSSSGNTQTAQAIFIVVTPDQPLIEPSFPESSNDWLIKDNIIGGVSVKVPHYNQMQVGDIIVLTWQAYDDIASDASLILGTKYSETKSVTAADLISGVIFTVPYNTYVEPIYDRGVDGNHLGSGKASYVVSKSDSLYASSFEATVKIDLGNPGGL